MTPPKEWVLLKGAMDLSHGGWQWRYMHGLGNCTNSFHSSKNGGSGSACLCKLGSEVAVVRDVLEVLPVSMRCELGWEAGASGDSSGDREGGGGLGCIRREGGGSGM